VSVDAHKVLGVLDQQVRVPSERKVTQGESCKARKKRKRESEHWPEGQRQVS
jgi:hypothetical protein